ncbi:hypothetical protein J5U22_01880 [Saccharolobus shibatae]|nr:hypothetical protein J5U22_01880 [Saccharolobus shibatae]
MQEKQGIIITRVIYGYMFGTYRFTVPPRVLEAKHVEPTMKKDSRLLGNFRIYLNPHHLEG